GSRFCACVTLDGRCSSSPDNNKLAKQRNFVGLLSIEPSPMPKQKPSIANRIMTPRRSSQEISEPEITLALQRLRVMAEETERHNKKQNQNEATSEQKGGTEQKTQGVMGQSMASRCCFAVFGT
ncbi:hypothetical protein L249_8263, partial [Ophiocordyceps polyrhachis-furcata BCC 54312]